MPTSCRCVRQLRREQVADFEAAAYRIGLNAVSGGTGCANSRPAFHNRSKGERPWQLQVYPPSTPALPSRSPTAPTSYCSSPLRSSTCSAHRSQVTSCPPSITRTSVVKGKCVSVSVDLGG